MSGLLAREIEKLEHLILNQSACVENLLMQAEQAVADRDGDLASRIINSRDDVCRVQVDIEEECLKVLALHQPVAQDLRLIVAVLKINDRLECIGDLAVGIARRAKMLSAGRRVEFPYDFSDMAQTARGMLHDSMDALVSLDTQLCRKVCVADDEIDGINRRIQRRAQKDMAENPKNVGELINLLGVSRRLELAADQAVNIAEDVIYLVEREIMRRKP